jgi:hypothetical protein
MRSVNSQNRLELPVGPASFAPGAWRLAWWLAAIGLLLGAGETHAAAAPSWMLDGTSPTVAATGSAAGEVLTPAAPPAAGPLSPPLRSFTLSALGLVAGDVPVTLSFGVDTERSSGAAGDVYRSFFPSSTACSV